jgi:ubiquinone/menaquinone biosynthesis C-methylase UbiE
MADNQIKQLADIYEKRGPLLEQINRVAPWHAIYRQKTLANIQAEIHCKGHILDLACGTGIFAKELAPFAQKLTLIDCLPSMLEIAKKTIAEVKGNRTINFIAADIGSSNEKFTIDQCDLVILTQALNFFSDLRPIFSLAAKCLKTNGIFYLDTDTQFRWAIIEALTGHLDNALEIVTKGFDSARNIVGADYTFHTTNQILETAKEAGFILKSTGGICHISCLVHIFNQSADFLNPNDLDDRASVFLSKDALEKLSRLDTHLEGFLPPEVGGWSTFTFIRKEVT